MEKKVRQLNEGTKDRIEKLDNILIEVLEKNLNVKVYQDNVADDEMINELNGSYHFVIFETGGMRRSDSSKYTLVQDVLIRYYAENMDNLDEIQVDVISLLESKGYYFTNSTKGVTQKSKEDAYVDSIEFNFTRSLKYVPCQ